MKSLSSGLVKISLWLLISSWLPKNLTHRLPDLEGFLPRADLQCAFGCAAIVNTLSCAILQVDMLHTVEERHERMVPYIIRRLLWMVPTL